MGMTQEPESDLELPPKYQGPDRQEQIMDGNPDHRGHYAAPSDPRDPHGTECLEPKNGKEAKEDADRRSASHRVGGILGVEEFVKLPNSLLDIVTDHGGEQMG